jgi:predicted DNA-binding protein (MmcQ/YjbR family)
MNLEQLRAFCLSLPGTTEDVKWEDHLCFCIGGKMYYITSFTHPSSSLKVPDDQFEVISASDGIIPAPYLARNKWIQVAGYERFTMPEWEYYIRQSYELVKSKLPKKLQQEIDSGNVKQEATTPGSTKAGAKKTADKKPIVRKAAKKKAGAKKQSAKKPGAKKVQPKKKVNKKAPAKKATARKARTVKTRKRK